MSDPTINEENNDIIYDEEGGAYGQISDVEQVWDTPEHKEL